MKKPKPNKEQCLPYKYLQTSKPDKVSEAQLQRTIASYLDAHPATKDMWYHCPNGGQRNKIVASQLKREGVKPGVPDVVIISLQLVIELKTKYNLPSREQLEWLEKYRAIGWRSFWVNSFDEFETLIKDTLENIDMKNDK